MVFHQYPEFTIIADHKPLLATLGPKEGIPLWLQLDFNTRITCCQYTITTVNFNSYIMLTNHHIFVLHNS